jgi:hypothetical protein
MQSGDLLLRHSDGEVPNAPGRQRGMARQNDAGDLCIAHIASLTF